MTVQCSDKILLISTDFVFQGDGMIINKTKRIFFVYTVTRHSGSELTGIEILVE